MATGMTSMVPAIPGTDARDFNVRMDQLKGKQFLEAFNSLKGGGTITEVEGRKAEQAIGRLDTAQSEEEFMVSLNELQDILNAGMQRKQQGITVGNSQPSVRQPSGRKLSMQQIQQAAAKNFGGDVNAAYQDAISRGYSVEGQ